jgi:hypothetical protein
MSRTWGGAARCETCAGYHEPAPASAAPVVLQAAKTLEHLPRMLSRTEAPKLVRELQQVAITHALAEDGDELIESILLRFRHGAVEGFVAWHNGAGTGVTLLRPMPRRVTIEQLRIELGLLKLEYVTCQLPNCFHEIRAKQDGTPRAHKNRLGRPCTLGRVLLNSPWFIGPVSP